MRAPWCASLPVAVQWQVYYKRRHVDQGHEPAHRSGAARRDPAARPGRGAQRLRTDTASRPWRARWRQPVPQEEGSAHDGMARAPRRARGPRDVSPVPAVTLPRAHEVGSRDGAIDVKAYVIDTHAFIWHVSRPKRLGRRALRALRD